MGKISNDSDIILFADDTNIFIRATSKDAAYAKANDILEKILNYMTCIKLHVNLNKSCYMYFSSTPKTYEPEESEFENAYELKIHDNILPKVTHTTFLGVIIDDRLSWDHQIKVLTKKLAVLVALIKSLSQSLKTCIKIYTILYLKVILPMVSLFGVEAPRLTFSQCLKPKRKSWESSLGT